MQLKLPLIWLPSSALCKAQGISKALHCGLRAVQAGVICLMVLPWSVRLVLQGRTFDFGMAQARGAAIPADIGSGILCGIAPRTGAHLTLLVHFGTQL